MLTSDIVRLTIRGRGTREFSAGQALFTCQGGRLAPLQTAAADVKLGDWVGVSYVAAWSGSAAALPAVPPRPGYGSEKQIRTPTVMSPELAFLLGAYLAEGHTTRSNWSVILTNSVESVLLRAQRAWLDVFGLHARITRQSNRCMGLVVSSKRLVEFMDLLQCGSRASNKRVPRVIAEGRRDHALTFLQGAALDAYVTHTGAAKWAICLESHPAIDGLQDLVTRLGVVNAQIPKYNRTYDKTYFELYAAGAQGQKLCRAVPFLEPDKLSRADAYMSKVYRPTVTDVIPGLDGPTLYASVPIGRSGRRGAGTGRQTLTHLCDPRTRMVSRHSVERVLRMGVMLPPWVHQVLDEEIHFAPVVSIS